MILIIDRTMIKFQEDFDVLRVLVIFDVGDHKIPR